MPARRGRPKYRDYLLLPDFVRGKTRNGQEMIYFLMAIMRNKVKGMEMTLNQRLEATRELLDRGWGKAPVHVQTEEKITHEFRLAYERALGDADAYAAALALANALCVHQDAQIEPPRVQVELDPAIRAVLDAALLYIDAESES